MKEFKLTEEYIELIRLIKYLRWSESGGHAKEIVDAGLVIRNGEVEYRKRAKLRKGDVIQVEDKTVKII